MAARGARAAGRDAGDRISQQPIRTDRCFAGVFNMSITAFDISEANLLGYIAAGFVFVTFWMKTMVPLRLLGIGSNIFFIAYGYLARAYPPPLLHVFLLPLNIVRLREMTQLIKQVEKAASGDLNMAWIKPFTSSRRMNAGEVLFSKGETAQLLVLRRLWALPSDRNRHRP